MSDDVKTEEINELTDNVEKKHKSKRVAIKYSIKRLKKELAKKPEVLHYILQLKECLLKRKKELKKLKLKLDKYTNKISSQKDASSQTDELSNNSQDNIKCNKTENSKDNSETIDTWNLESLSSDKKDAEGGSAAAGTGLSIAEQVKEAAESALQQTGMVYEATSGMYYDYNTGYYYNAELGLYYHSSTRCYYYFDKEQNQFVFHSQPDTTHQTYQQQHTSVQREKKKHRKVNNDLFDSLSSRVASMSIIDSKNKTTTSAIVNRNKKSHALESVASHYPPCMRIIVQETPVCKLKVGSLFLLTKDGGTLGREGTSHSIVIPEENVSRHHLTFSYDEDKQLYLITDMGSRNGTLLNGKRMSAAQRESEPMEIVHGSIIQLGGTKLLCHIHSGTATCGHCEPGLLIRDSPPPSAKSKEYKSVNLKKEYRKEIQRLKTKYKITPPKEEEVEPQMPEGYEDKARKRREEIGSIHHGAKTEQASLDTSIASTNKGFKMLEKMGWKAGDGLGKEAKGEQEPVPLISNVGTTGLGCDLSSAAAAASSGSKRDRQKTNMWIATQKRFNMLPTPKAFAEEDDSENDD